MKCIDGFIDLQPRRKQVKVACTNCRQSHACCSEVRPCSRCTELGLECVAGKIKKRGRRTKTTVERQPYLEGFVTEFCMYCIYGHKFVLILI
jgi:hypothetical protein